MLPLLVAVPAAHAAALATIVDGDGASLIDGARAAQIAEGVRLGSETIVIANPNNRLLRLEWPDGSVADLGPDTQAMVEPAAFALRGGKAPTLYLLRGWVKLAAGPQGLAAGLVTPRLSVQPFKGTMVVLAAAGETWAFAESGTAALNDRDPRATAALTLKTGEVFVALDGAKGAVAPRPTPDQLKRVPRGFRDSLPRRADQFKGPPPAPKPLPAPAYTELREWLGAEPALRKSFPKRFADRARDAAFRAGLADNLARHPEWDTVLPPERANKSASAPR